MLPLTRHTAVLIALHFAVILFCLPAWAIDYTRLSNKELYELKGAIQNAPETEQQAYQKEWQLRLEKMSREEAEHYQPDQEPGRQGSSSTAPKAPLTPGRGYDKQGTGTVIFGGIPAGR